jgi:hypothetical protein
MRQDFATSENQEYFCDESRRNVVSGVLLEGRKPELLSGTLSPWHLYNCIRSGTYFLEKKYHRVKIISIYCQMLSRVLWKTEESG